MFGLVLAVGILVDGGIVVVEYAERKMAEGMSKLEAFSVAGTRMFWPVLNGTLTTLCAFVPFMFWNSIPGKFMSFLPLTLFFVLGASIFIALIFTPALGSIFAKERKADAEELAELEKSDAIFVWFASTPHRVEFFLDEDPESVQVYVKARGNLNAQAQDDLVRQVEARVLGMQGVRALYVRSGNSSSFGGGRFGAPNDTIGTMEVEFLKYEDRVRLGLKGGELAAEVRRRVADIPGIETEVREPEAGPPTGKAIQVELRSNNPAAINAAADLITARLSQDPEIIELEDNRTSPGIEWNLAVDREAAGRFGVDVLTVGQAIQYTTTGVLVGRFRPDDAEDELDIRVRFTPDGRNLDALDSLKIGTPFGPVPASYFVDRQPAQQVTQIQRRDGQRLVVIQANVPEGVAANQKIAELRPWLEKAPLDAVLLSTVGVLLGVVVNVANTFNYISVIMLGTGVVALAGVVVGHNIVLVDSFYQLRRAGYNAHEAAVRSAAQRFRPVMLTTLVTVVGLLPLMFQFHPNFHNLVLEYQAPGSGQWVQLSAAVVWGLSFATLLTLILTPVMLAMPKVLSERFATVFDMIRRRVGLVARKRAYEGIRIPQGGPEAPSPTPAE